ncbi:MAG: cupin [Spirochaetes bacterium GWD1_61_31]|nr:MAG: cupin [Spirochaetes bacterium GWB1_60_80]OHD28474.1 MAG: cupin [Spirochaetes bacterium GWC1_61_12]OHD40090.1 MAG: cupin [Spirochaetes bacterium GWD1_61_31]OHD45862.1 MAG: cupin [Spirochaetes bacterium GWE1_60_18]OHD58405.1 MAG: cupin [Spirochaetes bacterium GWF1_60_12]HAW85385.1 cupin [Spirochaetaceae bacterium]
MDKPTAAHYIEQLRLTAHPEGGHFRQVLASDQVAGGRRLWTSIYFLLARGQVSRFHRLTADEVWYHHAGGPLDIWMISPDGELSVKKLGLDLAAGQEPQQLVPAGWIFGSSAESGDFSLVGCLVAPGFTFEDFELLDRETLMAAYPRHAAIIQRLT